MPFTPGACSGCCICNQFGGAQSFCAQGCQYKFPRATHISVFGACGASVGEWDVIQVPPSGGLGPRFQPRTGTQVVLGWNNQFLPQINSGGGVLHPVLPCNCQTDVDCIYPFSCHRDSTFQNAAQTCTAILRAAPCNSGCGSCDQLSIPSPLTLHILASTMPGVAVGTLPLPLLNGFPGFSPYAFDCGFYTDIPNTSGHSISFALTIDTVGAVGTGHAFAIMWCDHTTSLFPVNHLIWEAPVSTFPRCKPFLWPTSGTLTATDTSACGIGGSITFFVAEA